ncbi:MAG: YitT family protein [Oscillospiraceae bacterium]|nr:YitT family protein [Oscillospiraceae bacterium]
MKEILGNEGWPGLLRDMLFVLVGSMLTALAIAVFTVPNDIAPGGVSGMATALAYITPIRVGVWTLLLNVPLLLAAWRLQGPRPLAMTLIATVLLSFFIDFLDDLLPGYTNNPLLAAVFGGVLSGLGVGILFLRGISTGGTDLAALLLKRLFPNVPSGTLLLIVDSAVVAFAVCIFRDIEVALYSAITIWVSSKVIDALTQGVDYAKVIYIITDRGEEVSGTLNRYTDRGTTLLPAQGGYTGSDKQMVITVTRRSVLAQTLRLIRETDPRAFTFVMNSTEVHGEGFKRDE